MTPGLLPLSLYHVTGRRKVPVTPTNETRYRCFRDALPVRLGNAMDWRTLHGSQSGADPGPSNPAGCHITEKCRFDSGSLAEGLGATRGGLIP